MEKPRTCNKCGVDISGRKPSFVYCKVCDKERRQPYSVQKERRKEKELAEWKAFDTTAPKNCIDCNADITGNRDDQCYSCREKEQTERNERYFAEKQAEKEKNKKQNEVEWLKLETQKLINEYKKQFPKLKTNSLQMQIYKKIVGGISLEATVYETKDALVNEIMKHCNRLYRSNRPPKYESLGELLGAIDAYFDILDYVSGNKGHKLKSSAELFCAMLGISYEGIESIFNRGGDFAYHIKRTMNLIYAPLVDAGMEGKIPQMIFAIIMNNRGGYTQQPQEVMVTHKHEIELASMEDLEKEFLKDKQEFLSGLPEPDYVDDNEPITVDYEEV